MCFLGLALAVSIGSSKQNRRTQPKYAPETATRKAVVAGVVKSTLRMSPQAAAIVDRCKQEVNTIPSANPVGHCQKVNRTYGMNMTKCLSVTRRRVGYRERMNYWSRADQECARKARGTLDRRAWAKVKEYTRVMWWGYKQLTKQPCRGGAGRWYNECYCPVGSFWRFSAQKCVSMRAAAGSEKERRVAEAQKKAQAQNQTAARKLEALANQEIQSGQCLAVHQTAMKKTAAFYKRYFAKLGGDLSLLHRAHKIIVARPSGTALSSGTLHKGTYHVFSVSVTSVKLGVVRPGGQASRTGSRLERVLENTLRLSTAYGRSRVDSRVIHLATDGTLSVAVKGKGCTLIMIFHATR